MDICCSLYHQSSCTTSSSDNHYVPYERPDKHGPSVPVCSFRDPKNTLCLRCGSLGHWANTCQSSPSHQDHPIIVSWKNGWLINKAGMSICVIFNVKGTCMDTSLNHGNHLCSLWSDTAHSVTG